jgi:hypothetical protein
MEPAVPRVRARFPTVPCPACGRLAVLCLDRHEIEIDGRLYQDDLPACRCDRCRTTYRTDDSVVRFEADLAASLLVHGVKTPGARAFIDRIL